MDVFKRTNWISPSTLRKLSSGWVNSNITTLQFLHVLEKGAFWFLELNGHFLILDSFPNQDLVVEFLFVEFFTLKPRQVHAPNELFPKYVGFLNNSCQHIIVSISIRLD